MSKDLKPDLEKGLLRKLIAQKKQEFDEEYKKLSYAQTVWFKTGFATGNKKFDDLYQEYLKLQLPLKGNDLGFMQQVGAVVGTGVSAAQYAYEAASIIPPLKTVYNDWSKLRTATTQLDYTDRICGVLKNAGPLFQQCSSLLKSDTIGDDAKAKILQYGITPYVTEPVVNGIFADLMGVFRAPYESQLQSIIKNIDDEEFSKIPTPPSLNLLEDVSADFTYKLTTIITDILAGGLGDRELNQKVQDIYRKLNSDETSEMGVLQNRHAVLTNLHDILTNPNIYPLINKNLVLFLNDPENREDLTKIVENLINNKENKLASSELLSETVALVASPELTENIPHIVKEYTSFLAWKQWVAVSLTHEGLDISLKHDLLKAKEEHHGNIQSLITGTNQIINNLSPVLKDLSQYWNSHHREIISIVKYLMLKDTMKATAPDDHTFIKFMHDGLEKLTPFIGEMIPLGAQLLQQALSDEGKVIAIAQQAQLAILAAKEDQTKEIEKLAGSLIALKNGNPEIERIVEKAIPDLLTEHAGTLGPVVEKFLNGTEIGKKLKPNGKKIVKIIGKNSKPLLAVIERYSKRDYAGMVMPMLKIASKPSVIAFACTSAKNALVFNLRRLVGYDDTVKQPSTPKSKSHVEKLKHELEHEGHGSGRSL